MGEGQATKAEQLENLVADIRLKLSSQDLVEMCLSDFIEYIPEYSGGSELEPSGLKVLAEALGQSGIMSQPRMHGGYITRGIGSPVILFLDKGEFDHKAANYRYGLLLVQVAVIFARIDGYVHEKEILQIRRLVSNLDFLSSREKIELASTALYFLRVSTGVGGSEQVRVYLKAGLSKELALSRMESLSEPAKLNLIKMAIGVVTADGVLQEYEIAFLQDIYKKFGMSARSVRPQLEKYATENYIQLISDFSTELDPEILDEMDDVLGDLISDFDGF
jgi:hypothetical protein